MPAPQTPLSAASSAGARRRAGRAGRSPQAAAEEVTRPPCPHPSPAPSPSLPRRAAATLTGQLLVAAIPARPREPERGGEVCVREERKQTAQRSAPPSSPTGQAPRGKLAAESSTEEPRAEGKARGPLCGALPEGSRQIRTRGTAGVAGGGGGRGGAPRRSLRLTPPLGH